MLTLFRRHTKDCKFTGRKHRNCQCPIAVEGTLHGRMIRKSLDLRSWEAAQKLVRDWEAHPEGGGVTITKACEKFLSDAVARHLSEPTMKKIRHVCGELTRELGAVSLRSVTVDDIRKIRELWKLSALTTQKRLEMMRSFFRFCVDSGWIDRNPAAAVKLPVVHQSPTLPFGAAEMERILWAADTIREIHPQMPKGKERRIRAFILVMRYSGVRISDAVTLTPERVKEGKLFLYQAKTKQPVWVPIPDEVVNTLSEIHEGGGYYFWSGAGKIKTCITQWQEDLKKVFVIAGIPDGHAHRFRDTFAVSLLEKGIDLKTVSVLLGHTSIQTTERHYAPWVKSRQLALETAVQATFA
jgi:integrase/recombinase XerD